METENENPIMGDVAIISEYGSLKEFNCLTEKLTKNRRVKFISKDDDADNIDWSFKYRGKPLILQYNIYNGLSLLAKNVRDNAFANELAGSLRSTCQ